MKKLGIMVGIAAAGAAVLLYFATRAKAAPVEYVCPYCEEPFASYEELVSHVQNEHPGERIPLPIEWE